MAKDADAQKMILEGLRELLVRKHVSSDDENAARHRALQDIDQRITALNAPVSDEEFVRALKKDCTAEEFAQRVEALSEKDSARLDRVWRKDKTPASHGHVYQMCMELSDILGKGIAEALAPLRARIEALEARQSAGDPQ